MSKSEIIIRLGGEGGEGVISAGDMFTLARLVAAIMYSLFEPIRPRSRAAMPGIS